MVWHPLFWYTVEVHGYLYPLAPYVQNTCYIVCIRSMSMHLQSFIVGWCYYIQSSGMDVEAVFVPIKRVSVSRRGESGSCCEEHIDKNVV